MHPSIKHHKNIVDSNIWSIKTTKHKVVQKRDMQKKETKLTKRLLIKKYIQLKLYKLNKTKPKTRVSPRRPLSPDPYKLHDYRISRYCRNVIIGVTTSRDALVAVTPFSNSSSVGISEPQENHRNGFWW